MKIIIEKGKGGGWNVKHDRKLADGLGFDEMLGLVASITMSEDRPCLRWLKTTKQIKEWNAKYGKK